MEHKDILLELSKQVHHLQTYMNLQSERLDILSKRIDEVYQSCRGSENFKEKDKV